MPIGMAMTAALIALLAAMACAIPARAVVALVVPAATMGTKARGAC